MLVLHWKDEYSVDVEEMDNQHKRLIELINEFYEEGIKNKNLDGAFGNILDGLIDYTKFHFNSEEKLMSDNGFDGLDSQKKQHEHFIEKIGEFKSRYDRKGLLTPVEVTNFLRDWLINHIQIEDKKYGPFLNAKGIK